MSVLPPVALVIAGWKSSSSSSSLSSFFDARLRGAALERVAGVAMGLYLCERGTDAEKDGEWLPLPRLRRPDCMPSEDISPALRGYIVGGEMPASGGVNGRAGEAVVYEDEYE